MAPKLALGAHQASSPINAIWFIKTNFLTKYWCNSSFRSFYLCGLSKLKKSYVDTKDEPMFMYNNVYE